MNTVKDLPAFRNRFGLSQAELAILLGVSVMAVNRWERGVDKPSPLARRRLEEVISQLLPTSPATNPRHAEHAEVGDRRRGDLDEAQK